MCIGEAREYYCGAMRASIGELLFSYWDERSTSWKRRFLTAARKCVESGSQAASDYLMRAPPARR